MENAAERMLGLGLQIPEIKELAKDFIFGQMRVVIATMNIEEINADRDKLIANIATSVEVELKKVGLRLGRAKPPADKNGLPAARFAGLMLR